MSRPALDLTLFAAAVIRRIRVSRLRLRRLGTRPRRGRGRGTERRAGGNQFRDRQAAQDLAQGLGAGDDQGLDLPLGVGALVDGRAAGDAQGAQRFDAAVALFGSAGAVAGQCGLGGGDGVDRGGLALETAPLAVRPVDLDHVDVLAWSRRISLAL
ncbi:hypothetical protein ACBI99_43435 [Nonomuraea sp. ATR24]|uniref:hypothetical protein n=1 Tax=Nonomuraea sp. ATR24 TaxID=1676744 RepID=UPI0035C18962